MTIAFNDRALAPTLGTDDPEQISALAAMLNDPDSLVMLSAVEVESDEPTYVLANPETEANRLLGKYNRPT